MPPTDTKTIADQLRAAVKSDGRSVLAIAKAADVSQSALHRFMTDPAKELNITTVEALATALGFRLALVGLPRSA